MLAVSIVWRFSVEPWPKPCSGRRRAPLRGDFTGSRTADPLRRPSVLFHLDLSVKALLGVWGEHPHLSGLFSRSFEQTANDWEPTESLLVFRSRKSNFLERRVCFVLWKLSDTFSSVQLRRKDEINAEKVWFGNLHLFVSAFDVKKIQFPSPNPIFFLLPKPR